MSKELLKLLYHQTENVKFSRRQLLSIEEAWNLPISAEMSSRQQQQQQTTNQQTRSNSQTYQKNFQSNTPQGPPPPYPSPNGPNKRFKTENDQKPAISTSTPAFYLTTQQLQLMQHLQQNVGNLLPAQQVCYLFFRFGYNIYVYILIFSKTEYVATTSASISVDATTSTTITCAKAANRSKYITCC